MGAYLETMSDTTLGTFPYSTELLTVPPKPALDVPVLCGPDCGCHQDQTGDSLGYEYSE